MALALCLALAGYILDAKPSEDDDMDGTYREGLARVASPEFDAIGKFAKGNKESHGPRSGMLARSLSRFTADISSTVDNLVASAEAFGDLDIDPAVLDAIRSANQARPEAAVIHMDFATRGYTTSLAGRLQDLLSTGVENAMQRFSRVSERNRISAPRLNYGILLMSAGSLAMAATATMGSGTGKVFAGMMMAAGAFRVYESIKYGKGEEAINAEIGYPVDVHRLLLGNHAGTRQELKLPSPDFTALAKAALLDAIGDEALADRQFSLIDQDFSFQVVNNDAVIVSSMGISLNTLTGAYDIAKPAAPGQDHHVIATERDGKLTIVDQDEFDRLMDAAPTPGL